MLTPLGADCYERKPLPLTYFLSYAHAPSAHWPFLVFVFESRCDRSSVLLFEHPPDHQNCEPDKPVYFITLPSLHHFVIAMQINVYALLMPNWVGKVRTPHNSSKHGNQLILGSILFALH